MKARSIACQHALWSVLATGLPTLVAAQAPAGAEPALEEVIVTAQKREESVQDVPIAISAFSSAALDKLDIRNSNDLARFTPNLTWTPAGGAGSNIGMRGVTDVNFTTSQVGSVGIIVDEVALNSPVLNTFALFDLARVEVLRGPQVTLYGRSTSGGAVNFVTRRPVIGGDADGRGVVTLGNYDAIEVEGAVTTVLSDRAALRIAAMSQSRDGIFRNRTLGTDDSDRQRSAMRLSLVARLSDTADLFASAFYGASRGESLRYKAVGLRDPMSPAPSVPCSLPRGIGSGCTDVSGFADTGNFDDVYANDPNPLEDVTAWGATANIGWDIGALRLTSISSVVRNEIARSEDADGGAAAIVDVHIDATTRQFSQEFRLASTGEGALRWLAGVFYSGETQRGVTAAVRRIGGDPSGLPPPFDRLPPVSFTATGYDQDNDVYSAYGQVDYAFNTAWSMTLGARFSSEKKSGTAERLRTFFNDTTRFPAVGTHVDLALARQIAEPAFFTLVPYDKTWENWGGKIGANYTPNEDLLFYGSVSRGFKGGTFNFAAAGLFPGPPVAVAPPPGAAAFQRGVNPEKLTTYEVGFKSDLANGAVQINGAVFYNDYEDQQVFGFNADGVLVLRNAAGSTGKGIEFELKWAPAEGWLVQTGAGWIDATYDRFVLDDSVTPAVVADGNELVLTPNINVNALLRRSWEMASGTFSAQINALHTGGQYFEAENFDYTSETAHTVVDMRLGWAFGAQRQYDATLWARNVGDERFCLNSGTLPWGVAQCSPNEPRMFGVTISARF